MEKKYTTMFNAGNVYEVIVNQSTFSVGNIIKDKPYLGYFVDIDNPPIGNTLLFKIDKDTYMYIGEKINLFTLLDDEIVDYKSPVGNSDVPYPYAVGKKNTYLMIEDVYIKNSEKTGDPYKQYYTADFPINKTKKSKRKISNKPGASLKRTRKLMKEYSKTHSYLVKTIKNDF
jgi:hypothetical protein